MKTRKESKMDYKNRKFPMGVFRIVNNTNGKIYIGSSNDLSAAWNSHKFQLNAGLHPCLELQADWNRLGADKFTYEIVDEIKPDEKEMGDYIADIKALEEMLLEELQPFGEKGYNKRK
ncbi:MAG: GIY-YIG nuclease family protein [Lentimicrobium sp.]|jgi:hypothetical protein|nr:GIY-YIG nuclease family protein [Lentimicrobium sp.]MDD2527189.1 GIY-YIG nuclease family protein [Lentimicrobiaceae bacterium]MDD4596637.1 GIY-YIG nuclease family protein [Lentimicrobiaceae bacterium]MDY0025893.1 GIY-YIG nuclease family protein [Lentimicrobium sp.]HAH60314.1 excinuclease ABC subunit C [Bacteroidales bacterium]